jgi:HEAT repeat protein
MPTDLIEAIRGDAKALRRIARSKNGDVASMLARVALHSTSPTIVKLAATALARRKKDPAAIPALARLIRNAPMKPRYATAVEWAAVALAERKEPAAVAAAIATYRAMPPGRARYFLIQTLSNRTEREKALRANPRLTTLLIDVVRDRRQTEERADALWALLQIAPVRAVGALTELLADRDGYVRETAALALARIATKKRIIRAAL